MPNPTSKLNLVINGATTQLDIHDSNAVDLTNNQTVGGNKEFTGTTTAHDVIPSATDTYNFLYANNYYYNGVAWGLDKANVWNTYQTIKGYYFGNEQSTNGRTCLYLTSNRDTVGQSGIYITKFRQNRAQGAMNPADLQFITFDVLENSVRTNGALQLNVTDWNEDRDVPSGAVLFSNLSNAQLGSPLAPWKKLNGINPGALSLPNTSSYINIDTTNWDLTCSNNGLIANYVVEQSGWLELQIKHGSADIVDFWIITGSIRINSKSTFNTLDNRNFNMISLPVVEGDTLIIYGNASQYVAGRQIDYARIYTGLGQV